MNSNQPLSCIVIHLYLHNNVSVTTRHGVYTVDFLREGPTLNTKGDALLSKDVYMLCSGAVPVVNWKTRKGIWPGGVLTRGVYPPKVVGGDKERT